MILFWNKYHVFLQQLIKDSWFSLSRAAHSKQPGLETVFVNDDVSPKNKKKSIQVEWHQLLWTEK